MKKLLILVLFLVAILLVSCNTETPSESAPIESASNESGLNESADDTASHVHDYTFKIDYDEKYHFLTCECGNVHERRHRMEEGEVIKKSTCIEKGSRTIKCKDCEYSSEVPVSKISHDYKDEFCTMCGSHEPSEYIKFELGSNGWTVTFDGVTGTDRYDVPITELYIPTYTDTGEKVVAVGGFSDLHNLKKVVIPDWIEYLLPNAFNNCINLEEVIFLTDSSNTVEIQTGAFASCINLKKIIFPESCVLNGVNIFHYCKSLTSIDVPAPTTKLGEGMGGMFEGCVSLKKVTIPDTVESVGWRTFQDCYSLKEVDLGNGITELSYEMFRGCSSLETIVIPDSVTEIDSNVFYGCEKLKTVVLPKNLKSMQNYVFAACTSLESITIPKSIEYLGGGGVFDNCKALKEVNYEGTIEDWNNIPIYDSKAFSGSSVKRIICSDGVIEV